MVYEAQISAEWDGLGPLTILERATITQIVQRQATATGALSMATPTSEPVSTSLTPETIPSTLSSETTTADTTSLTSAIDDSPTSIYPSSSTASSQPPAATNLPSTARLSTGAIVGIAIGSIAALILLVTCLLFAFGFRIRRAKGQGQTEIAEPNEEQRPAIGASGDDGGKAELEDAGYTRRLERLHDGAKPELDGSKPRKTGWRAFSIRSLKRGSRPGVAELDAGPVTKGPHELPA